MRPPDRVIHSAGYDKEYLLRWHVIPRNRFFNVYLHKFLLSDEDRALHDHPWSFNASFILKGRYLEHKANREVRLRKRFRFYFRFGKCPHRVELINGRPVWTLFITGRVVRTWGFYCPQGWRSHHEFGEEREDGSFKGCD